MVIASVLFGLCQMSIINKISAEPFPFRITWYCYEATIHQELGQKACPISDLEKIFKF